MNPGNVGLQLFFAQKIRGPPLCVLNQIVTIPTWQLSNSMCAAPPSRAAVELEERLSLQCRAKPQKKRGNAGTMFGLVPPFQNFTEPPSLSKQRLKIPDQQKPMADDLTWDVNHFIRKKYAIQDGSREGMVRTQIQ